MTSIRKRLERVQSGKLPLSAAQVELAIIREFLNSGMTSCCMHIDRFKMMKCDMMVKPLPKDLFESNCKQCIAEIKKALICITRTPGAKS